MPWIQVAVAANANNYQQVEDSLLSCGALSITYKDAADKPILEPQPGETPLWQDAVITGLFDDSLNPQWLREQLRQQLGNDDVQISTETLHDQDWTRAWMDSYQPMRFGEHLWVCPKHIEPPEPEAVNLRLDPGLAFGTGTHPTTSLCLQWLDSHVSPYADYRTVLDYGCGSGILGIAALLLGAGTADCVDIDDQALQACRDNAAANAVLQQIRTYQPEDIGADKQYDLVLANILSGALIELAPTLAHHCHRGSDVVLSGILTEQAESVCNAYESWFDMSPQKTLDDWVLLHGMRKG